MKKFISSIIFIITSLVTVGCNMPMQNMTAPQNQTNTSSNSELFKEISSLLEQIAQSLDPTGQVSPEKAYSIYSGGKNYIVTELNFTNLGKESSAFYDEYTIKAFQNGIEIPQNNSWECGQFDLKSGLAHIQPNYSSKIYVAFETKDLKSIVDIECDPINKAQSSKASLSIDSKYYVSQEQLDKQKKEQEAKAAAEKRINSLKDLISSVYQPYYIYDFDKDGNSDIVFSDSNNYTVYIYENNNFVYAGSLDSTTGLYKSKNNGCYTYWQHSGEIDEYSFYKYEYHNGQIERNNSDFVFYSPDYNGPNTPYYEVDGKPVSKQVYESNRQIIESNKMQFIAPSNTAPASSAVFVN